MYLKLERGSRYHHLRPGVGSVCQSEREKLHFQSRCSFSLFFSVEYYEGLFFFNMWIFTDILTLSFVLRISDAFEFFDLLKLFCMQVYTISLYLCKISYYFISGFSLDITHLCNRTIMISLLLIREDVQNVFAIIILLLRN